METRNEAGRTGWSAASEREAYSIHYADRRDRWHRERGSYTFASDAMRAATRHERWQVRDATGNVVAYGDELLGS